MGKRSREHKQAVIAGTEEPFRTSPSKPKGPERVALKTNRGQKKVIIASVGGSVILEAAEEIKEIIEAENTEDVIAVQPITESITDRVRRLKEQQGG